MFLEFCWYIFLGHYSRNRGIFIEKLIFFLVQRFLGWSKDLEVTYEHFWKRHRLLWNLINADLLPFFLLYSATSSDSVTSYREQGQRQVSSNVLVGEYRWQVTDFPEIGRT